jgi:hypothetical protein
MPDKKPKAILMESMDNFVFVFEVEIDGGRTVLNGLRNVANANLIKPLG